MKPNPRSPVYQVRDWQTHFENFKSRTVEHCSYVCTPNKHHGLGFKLVMSGAHGLEHFAIWNLIVQTCSRQVKPREGWMTDDGTATGRPWTPADMAAQWGCNEEQVSRALEVFCSSRVSWLVKHESRRRTSVSRSIPSNLPWNPPADTVDIPSVSDETPAVLTSRAHARMEGNGTEGNGTEEKSIGADAPVAVRESISPRQYLDHLVTLPAFNHIDPEVEWTKIELWHARPGNKARVLTKRFLENWLGKIERPLNPSAQANGARAPAREPEPFCSLCDGKGTTIRYNSQTGEDETVNCRCQTKARSAT